MLFVVGRLEQHKDSQGSNEGPASKKQRLLPHILQSTIQNSASGRSTPTQQNIQVEMMMKEVKCNRC